MQSDLEKERQRRICVALWAYAYEFRSNSLASDALFDETCRAIRPEVSTGRQDLDTFFREIFHPDTGQWIHKHPELDRVAALYARLKAAQHDPQDPSRLLLPRHRLQ